MNDIAKDIESEILIFVDDSSLFATGSDPAPDQCVLYTLYNTMCPVCTIQCVLYTLYNTMCPVYTIQCVCVQQVSVQVSVHPSFPPAFSRHSRYSRTMHRAAALPYLLTVLTSLVPGWSQP